MTSIRVIAFDLDDTLLDTTSLLIPEAFRDAYQAMAEAGLQMDYDQFEELKETYYRKSEVDQDFFSFLMGLQTLSEDRTNSILHGAREAFYGHPVPEQLNPIDGTRPLLTALGRNYKLYLVTAGHPRAQQAKIDALNIAAFFDKCFIVDPLRGETKKQAFQEIIALEGIQSAELLSVGNRIDKEIADAKSLGATTCLVRQGEYLNLIPINPHQKPDYEIASILDLIKIC